MLKILAILLSLSSAHAQPVSQSGQVTPNHAVRWITNGVVGDAGTAANGFLTSVGVIAQGPGICQQDNLITQPYHQICLGINPSYGFLSFQNYGGASALPFYLIINGQQYSPTFNFTILAITRAQIPSTHITNAGIFTLVGYRTAGDLGYGAPYTCSGQTSSSLMAIQDADAVWCGMVPQSVVNAGWFGAYGNGSTNAITSTDIGNNPQWRGAYAVGTSWDTVAVQEWQLAALASASMPNTNAVGSAFLANTSWANGAGCTPGSQTFTVEGGTGTAATITATVASGGYLNVPLTVATGGSYTAWPSNPVTLSGGGCSTAPTADIFPSSIVWNSSPSRNETLNKNLYLPCAVGGATNSNYIINQPMLLVGSGYQIDFCSGTQLNWTGAAGVTMWTWNSGSYFTVNRMWISTQVTQSYGGAVGDTVPLMLINYDGTYSGLAVQNGVFNSAFVGVSSNGEGIAIAPTDSYGSQGSTITFTNLECSAFAGQSCLNTGNVNAFNLDLFNMDCQGFVFTCILNNAGTIYVFGSSAEASGPPYFNFTPVVSQFTTGGANFYNASGVGGFNESVIDGVRSQDEVGVYCQPGATCAVSNYTTYSESLSWNASSIFPEGNTVEGAANGSTNTKNRTFMLVDDGGNVTWNAVGAGSTDTVIQDPTASYSTNEWAGYDLLCRFSNGYTSIGTIASNTATTITMTAPLQFGCGTAGNGELYHIAGLTSGTPPDFDNASTGYAITALYDTGYGFNTTAGSANITFQDAVLTVGQYVVIPNADCLGSSPVYPSALIAKVTVASAPNYTLNKNACFTVGGGAGYYGTGFSDGEVTWLDLEFNAFGGGNVGEPSGYLDNVYANFGRVNVISYKNLYVSRSDFLQPGAPAQSNPANINAAPQNFLPGPFSSTAVSVTPGSTIALGNYTTAGNYLRWTPAQSETINFPAPSSTLAQEITLEIITSGTNSYTLTCGTNATCPATLATGTTSGAQILWRFVWNGISWVELSRAPNGAFGNLILSGTFTGADGGTWGSGGINGSIIGGTTPEAGHFTSGGYSSTFTGADSGTWGSGGINGSIIGGTTAEAGHFTTLATAGNVTSAGTAPTCTVTGAGSTGSCALAAGSNDFGGQITITAGGSGISDTGAITLTLNASLGAHDAGCTMNPASGTGTWTPPVTIVNTTLSQTAPVFTWTNASTNLTTSDTYNINYHCIGY